MTQQTKGLKMYLQYRVPSKNSTVWMRAMRKNERGGLNWQQWRTNCNYPHVLFRKKGIEEGVTPTPYLLYFFHLFVLPCTPS